MYIYNTRARTYALPSSSSSSCVARRNDQKRHVTVTAVGAIRALVCVCTPRMGDNVYGYTHAHVGVGQWVSGCVCTSGIT